MNNYCAHKGVFCRFTTEYGYCSKTACTNADANITNIGEIASTAKSYEEELLEESNVQKVVDFLEEHGIQIKTKYGYYRDTYDVLKDIGEHWEQIKTKF